MTILEVRRWDALFRIPEVDLPYSMVSSNVTDFEAGDPEYDSLGQFEYGGTEWLLELSRDPQIKQLAVPVDIENLRLTYQPPLTSQEIEAGHTRPANIDGSIAFYSSYLRHNMYRCGKIAHLPRPLFKDKDGVTAYGSYSSNAQQTGQLVITLPTAFLSSAVYPVTIDPTFGKTDIGATTTDVFGDNKWVCKYACSEAGTVTSIHYYTQSDTGGNVNTKGILHDDSSGPNALVTEGAEVSVDTSLGWETSTGSGSVSAADFWIGMLVEGKCKMRYDSGDTGQAKRGDDTYSDGAEDPFGSVAETQDYALSFYVTYTAAGGLSIPVAMHHYSHHFGKIIRG